MANVVDKITEKADAVFWLMKDSTLPPVIKINGSALSSAMGASLATKRTTAERLVNGVDKDALVIEPYANPFRVYSLEKDFYKFKQLFDNGVDCYVLNTGSFMGKDIDKNITLSIIENIVEGKTKFEQWGNISDISIMKIEGYIADFANNDYRQEFMEKWQNRIDFVKTCVECNSGINILPQESLDALEKVLNELKQLQNN